MKRDVVLLTMMVIALSGFAQFFERAVRFEMRYSLPVGDNFMNNKTLGNNGYVGIADAGIEYSVFKAGGFGAGAAFNISVLRLKDIEVTATGFLPKIFTEYAIKAGSFSIIPQVAFGYARWRYKGPDVDFTDDNGNPVHLNNKKVYQGIAAEGSLRFLRHTGSPVDWFLQGSWSFTRLEKPKDGTLNSDYNRNISIVYPGLGLVW